MQSSAMNELAQGIAQYIAQHVPQQAPAVGPLVAKLRARYGENLRAVLLYGSCLHSGDLKGLFDLYALVDSYQAAHANRLAATMNALLPPNVYYLEAELAEQSGEPEGAVHRVRAKYALLTLADFQAGVSPRWFHSYLWARFSQPSALVWARDDLTAQLIHASFAEAVCTFVKRCLPLLPRRWTIADLWQEGLRWTYRAEFRPEQPERQQQLFAASKVYYTVITPIALKALKSDGHGAVQVGGTAEEPLFEAKIAPELRRRALLAWKLRIVQGKALSLLRLAKAAFTFKGGVEYIVWKIERHSGVHMEVSPFLRRHPFLALCFLSLRLYRQGGVR